MLSPQQHSETTKKYFVNAPFAQLGNGELLELFIEHHLQPEIGLEGNFLWECGTNEFQDIAEILQKNELSCTLHAPFSDLSPGGFDKRIVDITREKLTRAFQLLPIFKPRSIVCHIGFEENKHRLKLDRWLETSLQTWKPLLEIADQFDVQVMLENTYETGPDIHKILFQELKAPHLGFCMDTGHIITFSHTGWQLWLEELFPWLGQLHLHDNDGTEDQHLAPGQGIFTFYELFTFLNNKQRNFLITLEPHSPAGLWQSLEFMKNTDLL